MIMKRIFFLILVLVLSVVSGCADNKESVEPTKLSFSDAIDLSSIQKLDGKPVTITGYMATVSPVSGAFMYLLNLPYQSCPFCVPNTSQLSNTMAVYAPSGREFDYTEQAIRVTGRMELGDFTDEYGYEYNYRIVDATYEIVDLSTVSDQYALWTSIASDGVVGELSNMFNYLSFVTSWPDYTGTAMKEDGSTVTHNLYPADAEKFLNDDGPYGFASYRASGYFEGLIARVNGINEEELADLAQIIRDAQALEQTALAELASAGYTYDEVADKYTLNNAESFNVQFGEIYTRYSRWLSKWEM